MDMEHLSGKPDDIAVPRHRNGNASRLVPDSTSNGSVLMDFRQPRAKFPAPHRFFFRAAHSAHAGIPQIESKSDRSS
jgi:hypothetical protein